MLLKKVEEFFGKAPSNGVNPDEAVAQWAAVQAGIIGWDVTDVLLLDVTPLSLSIETMGWVATRMIERNTTIPASKSETFSTAVDNQPSVEINVVQGEREMAADNKSLGQFKLDGIAPAGRWVPQIEVTFDIDANWVLTVKAKDKGTGKEQHITIAGSTGMDEKEVDSLVKEAEEKAEEDKTRKSAVEARNLADSTVHQSEKTLEENKEKVPEADAKEATEAIWELKKVLENTAATKEELEPATKKVNDIMMKVGQAIYAQPEAWAETSEAKADDGVVDAEEDNGDDKKNERV